MADLAGRVRSLERRLEWLMENMRMKAMVSSGLNGPDGRPLPSRVFEGTMNELFALTRALPTVYESDGVPPPPIETAGEQQ